MCIRPFSYSWRALWVSSYAFWPHKYSSHVLVTDEKVFQPHLRKFVLVFFDDILIYSHSLDNHLWHLEVVLTELQAWQLYANVKECLFAQLSVEHLEPYCVSGWGVHRLYKNFGHVGLSFAKNLEGVEGIFAVDWVLPNFFEGIQLLSMAIDRLTKEG